MANIDNNQVIQLLKLFTHSSACTVIKTISKRFVMFKFLVLKNETGVIVSEAESDCMEKWYNINTVFPESSASWTK